MSGNNFASIGQLVIEARNLLDSIKGGAIAAMKGEFQRLSTKMQSAIEEAKSTTKDAVKDEMRKVFYIDQVAGSDSNDGSKLHPVKTMKHISKQGVFGGSVIVIFKEDFNFSLEDGASSFSGVNLVLSSDSGEKKRVQLAIDRASSSSSYVLKAFTLLSGSTVEVNGVDLELPPHEEVDGKRYSYPASIFNAFANSNVSNSMSVRLRNCELIIPDPEISGWNLIGNPSGVSFLSMSDVVIPDAWRVRNKLAYGAHESTVSYAKLITNYPGAIVGGAQANNGR